MSTKTDAGVNTQDKVKIAAALLVVAGGVYGTTVYADEVPTVVRALGVLLSVVVGGLIAYQTEQGRAFWRFVQSARVEIRKVVWPTRQETVTTTGIVMLFAVILGIFFWLLDMFLLWVTRLATGYGG